MLNPLLRIEKIKCFTSEFSPNFESTFSRRRIQTSSMRYLGFSSFTLYVFNESTLDSCISTLKKSYWKVQKYIVYNIEMQRALLDSEISPSSNISIQLLIETNVSEDPSMQ
jgi:hypothetical protein